MTTLVSIDTETGALRRYEAGGSALRCTHKATPDGGPSVLSRALIEGFRTSPPRDFALEEEVT